MQTIVRYGSIRRRFAMLCSTKPRLCSVGLGSKYALLRCAALCWAEQSLAVPGADYVLLVLAVKCALLRFAVLC